jgi:hypothetical protein
VTQRPAAPIPADPAKYDEPRNEHARRRGLQQPYISGGEDPELSETLARERPYLRLLIGMVLVIVIGGFIVGFATAILGIPL